MFTGNLGSVAVFILCAIATVLIIALILGMISFFRNFERELSYLNDEIRRTEGREQRYWKRRKKKLWLSLLPFVRY